MDINKALKEKIETKTKPLGALGVLESLAFQVGKIQQTSRPGLHKPHIVVFAADHGIAREGVSAYTPKVTRQMVLNFLNGGAAINVFCRQHQIALQIVDAGVDYTFEAHENLTISKAGEGTANMLHVPAMTEEALSFSLDSGSKIVKDIAAKGCNIIGFGEMGIGNTSAASLITSYILHIPLEDCTGKGTGLADRQLERKVQLLKQVQEKHSAIADASVALQTLGGYEMAQICGGIIEAYRQNMVILIDGFIVTAALLVAHSILPDVVNNCVFCHQSAEPGHIKALQYLGGKPLLQLDLRLGEGTGCALAYPLVQSSVNFLNEMASFSEASISRNNE